MIRPIHRRVSAPSEVKGFAGWSIVLPPQEIVTQQRVARKAAGQRLSLHSLSETAHVVFVARSIANFEASAKFR